MLRWLAGDGNQPIDIAALIAAQPEALIAANYRHRAALFDMSDELLLKLRWHHRARDVVNEHDLTLLDSSGRFAITQVCNVGLEAQFLCYSTQILGVAAF